MDVLIVMCLGILVGRIFMSKSKSKWNEMVSIACTFILIFSMGVTLGKNDNFLLDLTSLGISSFIFFLIPTIVSVIVVYILTKKFLVSKRNEDQK